MKHWHTVQHGGTLKTSCWGKKPLIKGHIKWFHLHETYRTEQSIETENKIN